MVLLRHTVASGAKERPFEAQKVVKMVDCCVTKILKRPNTKIHFQNKNKSNESEILGASLLECDRVAFQKLKENSKK